MVRGVKYRIPVGSFLEWAHGMYRFIEEIYVPDYDISFNEEGYVFKTPSNRYEAMRLPNGKVVECKYLHDVEIDERDLNLMLKYLKLKEEVEKVIAKYFRKD